LARFLLPMGIPANLFSGIQYSRLPPKNKPRFHHYHADWQYIWRMCYKGPRIGPCRDFNAYFFSNLEVT
jgi:hypothetical protein